MKKLGLPEWAALAEITGTVAVVVSLLFVGLTVKQNTVAVQATNDNVIYELNDAWYGDVVSVPDLAELVIRYESDEQLTESEHRRVTYFVLRSILNWELAFVRFQKGMIPPGQWESWNHSYEIWIETAFRQVDWNSAKDDFTKDFADHVDAVYAKN